MLRLHFDIVIFTTIMQMANTKVNWLEIYVENCLAFDANPAS